jgi:hypothetical protein
MKPRKQQRKTLYRKRYVEKFFILGQSNIPP